MFLHEGYVLSTRNSILRTTVYVVQSIVEMRVIFNEPNLKKSDFIGIVNPFELLSLNAYARRIQIDKNEYLRLLVQKKNNNPEVDFSVGQAEMDLLEKRIRLMKSGIY